MSRGFGTTLGVNTTDVIALNGLTTHNSTQSYWVWFYENTTGGGQFGRIFDWDTNKVTLNDNDLTLAGTWAYNRSGAAGSNYKIHFTAPTIKTVGSIGLSHDDSSVANNAIVYLNGTKLTVGSGITVDTTATAPYSTVSAALDIGNRSDGARNWDGWLADFAIWNVILTDLEFAALATGVRPWKIRPLNLRCWLPLDGIETTEPDLCGQIQNGTLGGTAKQFGPPFLPITPRWPRYFKPPVAGAPFLVYQGQTLAIPLQTSVSVTLGVHS